MQMQYLMEDIAGMKILLVEQCGSTIGVKLVKGTESIP